MIAKFGKAGLVFLTALSLVLLAGCNDTLRQFITPVPKPTGDPGSLAHAVILSTQPTQGANGSTLHIDVSGDTLAGELATGPNPIFLGKASGRAFVINSNNTITAYTALLPQNGNPTTITLNGSTITPVAGGVGSSGDFYTTNMGSAGISQISSAVNAQLTTIPVGTNPVAIAGNSANSKIYVVNNNKGQPAGSVTVVSVTDNSVVKTIPVGKEPIWAVMSADGVFVFVVNQGDGTVMVIDTTLDIVLPCTATDPACNSTTRAISVGSTANSSPNFAFFDTHLQRLYVTNTGENTVAIIKADGINSGLGIDAQLLKIVKVSGTPISVAALSDGSKAYAALANCPSGTNHTNLVTSPTPSTPPMLPSCTGNLVSVIDAVALQETKTIQVGHGVVSVDTAADASRVYAVGAFDTTTIIDNVHNPNCAPTGPCGVGGHCIVAPCIPGTPLPDRTFATPSVSIIKTAADTVFVPPTDPSVTSFPIPSFFAPQQDPACVPAIDSNFNKNVAMPCPGQTPFMVRVFP